MSQSEQSEANSSAKKDRTPAVPDRIDCTPENVEQGLARLVLSLIELIRQLLERQAIRRMQGGSLSEEQIDRMGEALMKLEAKVHELAGNFGLTPADLNLDLGPLGRLLDSDK
ncbi:MAG TPA: gas vesicle protein K [Candidatus Sulfotelmatobacter sp.]|nr:gas vesicle protein K [Candidatus Sulfotelmatobacter sp.]